MNILYQKMSGISAIYFLDREGKPIIFRNFRADVVHDISQIFQKQVLELEESNMKPFFTIENVHYCWMKHRNIFSNLNYFINLVLAVSKININIYLIFSFLNDLKKILIDYLINVEEESIKDNFVLIYELLDEIIDNGYPQMTDAIVLKEYIKTESNEKKINLKREKEISNTLTSSISWRTDGIYHKKNEVYLDVIEKIDAIVSYYRNIFLFLILQMFYI